MKPIIALLMISLFAGCASMLPVESDPCTDPVLLHLEARDLRTLSGDEYAIYVQKRAACVNSRPMELPKKPAEPISIWNIVWPIAVATVFMVLGPYTPALP